VLVTLLVIWVIAIPALTVIGTYVASGVLRRRAHSVGSPAVLAGIGERIDACPADTQRISARPHGVSRRTRGHALAGR
jgi:hypothetical protein